jgi:WD40 repeat protein
MEKDKELSPEWELAFEGKAFSRFHKVLPMVAICSEQDVIEIYNYRSHKLISLFDIKAFMNLNEQRPGRPFLPVDLIFYDKPSIVWNTSGTDVATFTNQSIPNHQESYLFVVDANSLLRWDIKDSKHVQVDLITDRKQRIVQGMLYDETSLILAYDDGQLKLFDIKAMNIILCLQGHHKSEIIDMLVFSRENSSKPLVVALDKSGQTICWNVQSGKPAFKLSENNKQKQVRQLNLDSRAQQEGRRTNPRACCTTGSSPSFSFIQNPQ